MSSFQYLKGFVHNNHDRSPKELRVVGSLSLCRITRQSESLFTPTLGFCLRVIVNENLINLEKTTSSVLAVILINLCVKLTLWLQLRSFTKRHLNCFKLFVQVYLKKKTFVFENFVLLYHLKSGFEYILWVLDIQSTKRIWHIHLISSSLCDWIKGLAWYPCLDPATLVHVGYYNIRCLQLLSI